MKNILLVGKNSFIASNLAIALRSHNVVDHVSYHEIDDIKNDKHDLIINCSLNPAYKNSSYSEEHDIDLRLSRRFKGHHVMFSSRKVYGSNDRLISYAEESPVNPIDYYGQNKSLTEIKIKEEKKNVLILRCSNVCGYELGRKSFLGFCLNQLKEKSMIELDFDYTTKRDFINIDSVCDIVSKICDDPFNGTYNLSSNIPYAIGDLALNLIEGNGTGHLVCATQVIFDQFVLDNTKLLDKLRIDCYDFNIKSHIIKIGRQLCKI